MAVTLVVDLDVELDSEEQAERLRAALDVDSDDYVELSVKGRRVVARARGPPGTVWNTIDDVLACLSVAVGVEEVDDALDEGVRYE